MLDDRKFLAIQHLAEGVETRTKISKLVGISRATLYDWLDDEKFKAELNRRIQQRKDLVETVIDSKLDEMVNQLAKLATTSENDMVRSQTMRWWIEMGIGKATNKHELKLDNNNTKEIDDDLLNTAYEDIIDHNDK